MRKIRFAPLGLSLCLLAACALSARAQTTTLASATLPRDTATEASPAQKYFTDVVLVNQNGERVRLYSDLLKDKVVIINAFFATCNGSCPPMSHNLARVQDALADRMGKDVVILSLTVDPSMDTPERLKEYAAKMGAKPGWYFLTGEQANVELAQRKLGQYVADKQDHKAILLVGNVRTGLWKKAFALAPSDEIVELVQSVLTDK
ncbi:MAG: SCO family protein [Acidobacteria bacterium]|nr:SCO family protein [Acidobacteriota bacterium]